MCDYSLENYDSRPAEEGEHLITTRFPSGSLGFAAAGAPRTPVCMDCDKVVDLSDIPAALQTALRIGEKARTNFAQREAGLYRDGLRLADGRFVSLQDLQPGIRAYIPTTTELIKRAGVTLNGEAFEPEADEGDPGYGRPRELVEVGNARSRHF